MVLSFSPCPFAYFLISSHLLPTPINSNCHIGCMAGRIRLICFSLVEPHQDWEQVRFKTHEKCGRGDFPRGFPACFLSRRYLPRAQQSCQLHRLELPITRTFFWFPLKVQVIDSWLYLRWTACGPCKLLFFVKLTKHWITLTPIQRNLKPNLLSFKLFSLEMCIFLLGEGITPEVPTHVGDHKLRQTLIQRCDHLSDEVIEWRDHKIKRITH